MPKNEAVGLFISRSLSRSNILVFLEALAISSGVCSGEEAEV